MEWLLLWCVIGADADYSLCCNQDRCLRSGSTVSISVNVQGTSAQAHSESFAVACYSPKQDARQVAQAAETWKQNLQTTWEGKEKVSKFSPVCQIVVHGSLATYQAAVGRGVGPSLGSTFIDFQQGKIKQRRIDLLVDESGAVSALPHELTHVVLFDVFEGKQAPPWADEGIAILVDCMNKRELHQKDSDDAVRARNAFSCVELLALESYPSQDRIPAFYGQSASLVSYLCGIAPADRFPHFIKQARKDGYDRALKDCYGIQNVAHLQALWHYETAKGGVAAKHPFKQNQLAQTSQP